ncbi:MAG: alpha/beta hydrolase [Deltaproteobacteria bacterium]|nr:alpha/beta hydrolase [Deltaproteobacteria bacterium]
MMTAWSERFVPGCDGTRLYTRERANPGARATVVLCDGIACDGFIWRYLENDLADLASIVHWNYRGHGRSGTPDDPTRVGMDALAGDLDAIRRATAPEGAVLVGHSLGCQVVLESYRSRPEGVAGIVLICGAPGRVTHSFKGSDALARALPKLLERVERHPVLARAVWANLPPGAATKVALATGEVDAGVNPDDLLPYMEHVTSLDVALFLRMLAAAGEVTAEDVLPQIRVPTLIVAGELDSFTPPHLARSMASAIPGAELMLVEGGTHVVPIERREAVRARVTAFLEERLLRS